MWAVLQANTMVKTWRLKNLIWLLLSVLVFALDQLTKTWALITLPFGIPQVKTFFFNLTLLTNQGAAFSLLSHAGGWQQILFALITLLVSVAIVIWLLRLKKGFCLLPMSLSLILGGALGNFWDRCYYGFVIDFLQFHYQRWYWPAFNLADSAIVAGGFLLFIVTLKTEQGGQAAE